MKATRTNGIAALWGVAEATVFFIVPDVMLSWVALKDYRRAMIACLWVLAGALLGGSIIWYLGAHDPVPLRRIFTALPAVNDAMLANVGHQLQQDGLLALFIGPLTGTPYKLYALEAGSTGFNLGLFLLISIPARLIRFLLVVSVTAGITAVLRRSVSLRIIRASHLLFWTGFYAWFFHFMSGVS